MRNPCAATTPQAPSPGASALRTSPNERLVTRAAIVLLGLALCANAAAFGAVGHRLVGRIADELLDTQARAAVAQLLSGDLNAWGKPSGASTLEAISLWADDIRGSKADRPTWHYDGASACGSPPTVRTWCGQYACASGRVEQLGQTLLDAKASRRQRNEALKWIVHLAGDLHQPLHAANNVYTQPVEKRRHDSGGNGVQDVDVGFAVHGYRDLHTAWDSHLVERALGVEASAMKVVAESDLNRLIGEARAVPAARLAATPMSWALESNQLARGTVYTFEGFACGAVTPAGVKLSPQYVEQAGALLLGQISLAGARLAYFLNRALGKGP